MSLSFMYESCFEHRHVIIKYRLGYLALVSQLFKEKENSAFKLGYVTRRDLALIWKNKKKEKKKRKKKRKLTLRVLN